MKVPGSYLRDYQNLVFDLAPETDWCHADRAGNSLAVQVLEDVSCLPEVKSIADQLTQSLSPRTRSQKVFAQINP